MKKFFPHAYSFAFCFLFSVMYAQQPEKLRITNIDDVPRHTYDVQGSLTELITNKEIFKAFSERVRTDIEHDLEMYDIGDKTTLKKFWSILVELDMLESEYERALSGIAKIRGVEDKPADKLTGNLIDEAIIKAKTGKIDDYGLVDNLTAALTDLPRDLVQDRIEAIKGDLELISRNILIGVIQSQYEPGFEKSHQLGGDVAFDIIDTYYLLEIILPYKDSIVKVLDEYISRDRIVKNDIWNERRVDLSEVGDLDPVVVAVWDTGVDTAVFPDRLFVNENEKIDGQDNDNNGYIDDIHGVAFNLDADKVPELLYPIENPQDLRERKDLVKGLSDLESAIDSPEAATLKRRLAVMNPEDVKPFIEQIVRFGLYLHGTYTAGLAVADNPYARILVVRLTDDYRMVPLPATIEKSKKWAQMYQEVVDYVKASRVRVVNMSWSGRLRTREANLEANAIGKDSKERALMAREMFDIEKDALFEAIKSAPEVLFVTSAGNKDDDVAFEDHYPNAFDLPNLLVVGAVDQAGDETSFTSFGAAVDVYANGFEVEGYIPGGDRLSFSGTSAASPNAANLAAKLFALDPLLTPPEVIGLIKEGSEPNSRGLPVMNPRRSVGLLEKSWTE